MASHILLVEDEAHHVALIRRAFADSEQTRLTVARSLREARACLATDVPDLLLADWRLPDGEGTELITDDATYPVVLMTSFGDEQVAVEAMKAGALDYVVKSAEALSSMPRLAERVLREWTHITERQRAEAALRASEQRFRSLVEHGWDTITLIDPEGTVLYASTSLERMLGYTVDEHVGEHVVDLVHPDDQAYVTEIFQALLDQPGEPISAEVRARHKDGTWRWVETTSINRLDDPAVEAIVANSRDITERKQAEAQLTYQARLLESVSDAIISTDMNFRVLSWNKAAEAMYGWHADEVLGKRFLDVAKTAYLDTTRADVLDLFLEQGAWRGEVVQKHKNGEDIHVLSSVVLLRDEAGAPSGTVAVNRDITERKRLEREVLEISNREQRRIGRDLHDGLGQVITGGAFFVSMLERELAAQEHPMAEVAEKIDAVLNEAIAQARALARGLNPVGVETGGLHQGLLDLTASMERIYEISCMYVGSESVYVDDPEVAVHVYRIAQEALNNAVKHGQASNLEVILRREGNEAVLTVRDDGVGIPDVTARGEGMGLYIMAYRARMINGKLEVRRGPERGTILTCRFPQPEDSEAGLDGDEEKNSTSMIQFVEQRRI